MPPTAASHWRDLDLVSGDRTGSDVMILKNIFFQNWRKKYRLCSFLQKFVDNIGYCEKRHFFAANFKQIAENCDQNIDPGWTKNRGAYEKLSIFLKIKVHVFSPGSPASFTWHFRRCLPWRDFQEPIQRKLVKL
jgi:hypothetical protein